MTNCLYGRFDLNSNSSGVQQEESNQYNDGLLDLYCRRISIFHCDGESFFYNPQRKTLVALIGYISNLEEIKKDHDIEHADDVQVIEELYSRAEKGFINELDGIYTLFIYEQESKRAFLCQDEYGSNQPIYYLMNRDEFIFSTSLKLLLRNTEMKRELNHSATRDFLFHKYIIPNESTLIDNIHKVVPGEFIAVDIDKRVINRGRIKRKSTGVARKTAEASMITSIADSITQLEGRLSDRQEIAATLSAGYDTNIILSILRKASNADIKAITIGGRVHNEIPAAERIVSNSYDNVSHITKTVEENIVDSFPDIVWRIEGYAYSPGLFLQYELGRILSDLKCRSIFLGDCADHQLDQYSKSGHRKFIDEIKRSVKKTFVGDLVYSRQGRNYERFLNRYGRFLERSRYEEMFELVIKKNGIMLNSFGIQGLYVFLTKDIKSVSRALGKLNRDKKFYKEKVLEILGDIIAEDIEKLFGTTDIDYLFEANRDLFSEVLESDVIKSVLGKFDKEKMLSSSQFNSFCFQMLYIYLFNELFISGKYDSQFENEGIGLSLGEILH